MKTRKQRYEEAIERQKLYKSLSAEEKLELISFRRGNSAKEKKRLENLIQKRSNKNAN